MNKLVLANGAFSPRKEGKPVLVRKKVDDIKIQIMDFKSTNNALHSGNNSISKEHRNSGYNLRLVGDNTLTTGKDEFAQYERRERSQIGESGQKDNVRKSPSISSLKSNTSDKLNTSGEKGRRGSKIPGHKTGYLYKKDENIDYLMDTINEELSGSKDPSQSHELKNVVVNGDHNPFKTNEANPEIKKGNMNQFNKKLHIENIRFASMNTATSFTDMQNPENLMETFKLIKAKDSVSMNKKLSLNANKSENSILDISIVTPSAKDNDIEKWKKFGYLLAESYDEIKGEYKTLLKEKETDKKIIKAMKEQIEKLKALLENTQNEAKTLRDKNGTMNENTSFYRRKESISHSVLQEEIANLKKEFEKLQDLTTTQQNQISSHENEKKLHARIVQQLNEKLKITKKELSDTKKAMELQKGQNEKGQIKSSDTDKDPDRYKQISERHLRECSELAEQVICLRTDLDRSQSSLFRAHQQLSCSIDRTQQSKVLGEFNRSQTNKTSESSFWTTKLGNMSPTSAVGSPQKQLNISSRKNEIRNENLLDTGVPLPLKIKPQPIGQGLPDKFFTGPIEKVQTEFLSSTNNLRRSEARSSSRKDFTRTSLNLGGRSIDKKEIKSGTQGSKTRAVSAKPPYTTSYNQNKKV